MKEGWFCGNELCVHYDDCDEPRFLEENCQCMNARRKWETPEEFKHRTGRKYPGNMAVYVRLRKEGVWFPVLYCNYLKSTYGDYTDVICANTDFGPPPDGWMPEDKK